MSFGRRLASAAGARINSMTLKEPLSSDNDRANQPRSTPRLSRDAGGQPLPKERDGARPATCRRRGVLGRFWFGSPLVFLPLEDGRQTGSAVSAAKPALASRIGVLNV